MATIFELKSEVDLLRRMNSDLQERLTGVYGAYETLRYTAEKAPDFHERLALQMRIKALERLLDQEVQGWRFKLKGGEG